MIQSSEGIYHAFLVETAPQKRRENQYGQSAVDPSNGIPEYPFPPSNGWNGGGAMEVEVVSLPVASAPNHRHHGH